MAHARLQLLRQPQPLQLQRHVGRVDRRRAPQLGHDVQQLRPQRHHEPHSHHLGSTGETIHSYPDGLSVTDKGSLASICPGALACTWLFTGPTGRTTETDQRFNENYTFTNVGAAGAYDYESISTHETGHSIGLDHANSSNALTMYFQTSTGTTYARSLAKGDVLGMRARYP